MQTAAALTNIIIAKHKSTTDKELNLQFKTSSLMRKEGFNEKNLTQVAQFVSQMLESHGYKVITCGFPWADAAHTEYHSIDVLYIDSSKP
jgi:hypothetical protein